MIAVGVTPSRVSRISIQNTSPRSPRGAPSSPGRTHSQVRRDMNTLNLFSNQGEKPKNAPINEKMANVVIFLSS